ncbi:hypothetical protein EGW08_014304 [Elysia chlorotica]|uniref:Uncharacterized protein n=1 Tax=Elysia chlorotica TaxID=188477 RepID=A0A433T8U2_ELYCH|nr:hypothetical protein EGW08_014304 [Elysia chlorotica]
MVLHSVQFPLTLFFTLALRPPHPASPLPTPLLHSLTHFSTFYNVSLLTTWFSLLCPLLSLRCLQPYPASLLLSLFCFPNSALFPPYAAPFTHSYPTSPLLPHFSTPTPLLHSYPTSPLLPHFSTPYPTSPLPTPLLHSLPHLSTPYPASPLPTPLLHSLPCFSTPYPTSPLPTPLLHSLPHFSTPYPTSPFPTPLLHSLPHFSTPCPTSPLPTRLLHSLPCFPTPYPTSPLPAPLLHSIPHFSTLPRFSTFYTVSPLTTWFSLMCPLLSLRCLQPYPASLLLSLFCFPNSALFPPCAPPFTHPTLLLHELGLQLDAGALF